MNYDSIGSEITDLSWMRNGRINIRITNAVGELVNAPASDGFSLILVVWQIPPVIEALNNAASLLTTYTPRSFRILINSKNAISGSPKDGIYRVNLPVNSDDKYKNW